MNRSLFLVLMLACFFSAPAQESKLSFGTGIGLNVTNVRGTGDIPGREDIESVNLTGIRFYSLIGYRFSKNLVLLVEPGYEQKGFKYNELTLDSTATLDTSLWTVSGDLFYMNNYFSIPVTLNLTAGNKIRLNAGAGAYLAILTESKLRVEANQSGVSPDDIDYSNSFNSLDYGVLARASVEFKLLSFLALEVGASYSLGLSKLNTDEYFSEASLRNKSIYAGAGVRFYFAGSNTSEK